MALVSASLRRPALSPWRDLEEMSNRLTRLFEQDFPASGDGLWSPPVNVSETPEELILSAEIPGVNPDDVSLDLENNVLSIRGEKREERTGGDEGRYHLWERRYGSFQRSFTLPRTVKADGIRASFKDGVLSVHIPKSAEAKGRRIAISKGV